MKQSTPFSEISIFEAENLLFESLQLLKDPDNLDPIRSKLVGDFWDPSWLRAPFEECLTFRQLSTLSHETLVKKKSLNGEKMAALAHAIKRAITSKSTTSPRQTDLPPQVGILEWKLPEDFSATAATLLGGFAQYISKLPQHHAYRKVGTAIIHSLDPLSFCAVWFSITMGDTALAILEIQKTQLKKLTTAGFTQLCELLHEHTPELALHWKTALTGVGTSEENLFAPYNTQGVPVSFIKEFGRVLICCLGAQPVLIKGKQLPFHWSSSPKSADSIVNALKLDTKKSKALETLSLPFPFFDIEALYGHIKKK